MNFSSDVFFFERLCRGAWWHGVKRPIFSAVFALRGAWLGCSCCVFFCLFQSSILHLRRMKEIGEFVSSVNIVLVLATYFQTCSLLLLFLLWNWKLNGRRRKQKQFFNKKKLDYLQRNADVFFAIWNINFVGDSVSDTDPRDHQFRRNRHLHACETKNSAENSNGYAHLTRSRTLNALAKYPLAKNKNNENKQTQIQNKPNGTSRPQRMQRKKKNVEK